MPSVSHFAKFVSVACVAAFLASAIPTVINAQSSPAPGAAKGDQPVDLKREEAELRKAIKANPNDPAGHLKLGTFYYRTKRNLEAEVEATEAKRLGASPSDTDPLLSWVLLLQGKSDDLLSKIKPGDRAPAAESKVRLTLGTAYLTLKSYKSAETMLRDSIRLDPSAPMPHLTLADVHLATGDLAGAREEIKAAQQIAPERTVVTLYSGRLLLAEGKPDQAIEAYTKVLDKEPENIVALDERAGALLDKDKLAEAGRDIDAGLKSSNRDAQTLYLSAMLMARQGKLKEAEARLSPLANGFGKRQVRFYLAGTVAFGLGKIEQADAYLVKFITFDRAEMTALRLRCAIALQRKDSAGVEEMYKPVVAANPADHEATIILARAYVASGGVQAALDLYKKAIEAASSVKAANAGASDAANLELKNIATIDRIAAAALGENIAAPAIWDDLRQGDVAKAAAAAESAAKDSPDDPSAQELLGAARLAQKRYPESETIFRDILKAKPDSVTAMLNLAKVLVAENHVDDAKLVLQNMAARGL